MFPLICSLLLLVASETPAPKTTVDPAAALRAAVAQCKPENLIAATVPGYLAATGDTAGVAVFLDRPESAGYALEWPFALQAYFRHSGDMERTSRLAEEALPFWFATYDAFKTETGLLLNLPEGFSALPAQSPGISAPVNALYFGALIAAADICARVGRSHRYTAEADQVADAFAELIVDPATGLYREGTDSEEPSLAANAIALSHGLYAGADRARMAAFVRRGSISAPIEVRAFVIAALRDSGSTDLAAQLLTIPTVWAPCTPEAFLTFATLKGFAAGAAPAVEESVHMISNEVEPLVSPGMAAATLAGALPTGIDWAYLSSLGWAERAGAARAVWIDVDTQMLHIIEQGKPVWQARIASAKAGTGSRARSFRTPLGWHKVVQKIGAQAPWGQVFRSRNPTRQVWKPGDNVAEDMVLTRILWLDGLESGMNKGKGADGVTVDSKERCIYIHGTNGEALIGTPSSHGCIRMLNDDVIKAFELIPDGAPVLITERSGATAS